MTITNTVRRKGYDGDGSTTVFAVPFAFFELDVYIDGTLATQGVDYTITQDNPGETGSITCASPPAEDEGNVVIIGNTLVTQGNDYEPNGPLPANTLERNLDRLTAIAGELQVKFQQCISVPTFDPLVPAISFKDNPNTIFYCDADGVPGLVSITDDDNPVADAFADAIALAQGHAEDAEAQAELATTERGAAQTANSAAQAAKNAAETAQAAAEAAEEQTGLDAASASTSADSATASAASSASDRATAVAAAATATTQASNAASAASTANSHRVDAQTARTGAEAAQTAAESAQADAESAKDDAETAQAAAEAALDDFTDLYLGSKSSDPTLDNDGDSLIDGAVYYNSSTNRLRVWNGSAWENALDTASGIGAEAVVVTPVGALTATDAQAAFEELDSDLTDLESAVDDNTADIATNTADIATNTADIAANESAISGHASDIAANTADIADIESDAVFANATKDLGGNGYTSTSEAGGTITSGTFTPSYADGAIQHITANGAFTLGVPSGHGCMQLDIVNGASAGAINTSGFDYVVGEFTTVNADKFRCWISTGNNGSMLNIQAMQE